MNNITVSRKSSIIEPDTLTIGIDLGKKTNVAVVLNYQDDRVDRFSFGHSRKDYELCRQRLAKACQQQGANGILVGMEPTNYFWKLVAADLEEQKIPYRLVNAYTVKKYREGTQIDSAKNDERDARAIAELIRIGKYTKTQLLRGKYADLRNYANLHRQLVKDISRQRARLHEPVGHLFPELREVFKALDGLTVRGMLTNHAAAAKIRSMKVEDFIERVRADYEGKRLPKKKLRQAHQLAQQSVGLLDTEALQMKVTILLERIDSLIAQQERVKARLLATFESFQEAQYMVSLGLGQMTTALLLAEIGNPSTFSSSRQLVKLAGLQPTPNRSGQRQSGATPISRKGRGQMRTLLYFACMRRVQTDEAFASYYRGLKERSKNPLAPRQALIAASGKAVRILWGLITNQCAYNPALWEHQWNSCRPSSGVECKCVDCDDKATRGQRKPSLEAHRDLVREQVALVA